MATVLQRSAHAWLSAAGGPRPRLVLALWCGVLEPLACTEHERPDRLPDVPAERRAVTGSFGAPTGDAGVSDGPAGGAGASGCGSAGSPCGGSGLDAGSIGMAGTASTGTGAGSGPTGSGSGANATSDRPVTVRQSYAAFCEGSTVQWGFFTYGATTPGDSSIRMRVRTAPTEAGLQSAAFFNLATASSALGTSRCRFTGPAPCPIDLFEVLGGAPLVHHPLSELEVLLTPSSIDQRMPTVDAWQLDYSCTENL